MRFKKHFHLEGQHEFLSPSVYHWINYDEERLEFRYKLSRAAIEGMEQHRYAAIAIEEREIQDDETTTVGMYINQCIQYHMHPEVVLYFSLTLLGLLMLSVSAIVGCVYLISKLVHLVLQSIS